MTTPDELEVEFGTSEHAIRADALMAAIAHLTATGELPDAIRHQPRTVLGLADVYAAYIADGSRP
jgi:hypothetical protein